MHTALLFTAMLLCGSTLFGQTMRTVTAAGTDAAHLDSIAVVTFNGTAVVPTMTVTLKSGTDKTTALASITKITFDTTMVSGIDVPVRSGALPINIRISPNPVFSSAAIGITLVRDAAVTATVYPQDGSGPVALLHNGPLGAGTHSFAWDGNDLAGRPVPNGTYVIVLDGTMGRTAVKTLVIR